MKTIKHLFTILIFFLLLFIYIPNVKADEITFYSIKASVGATESEVGINYHTNSDHSKLYLSLNENMSDAVEFVPEQHVWEKGIVSNDPKTGFQARYVCQVNISNLLLDTDYYYQIKADNASSSIKHFKTTKTSKTTFGVLCDTQASGSNFKYSDQLVEKLATINPDINFFMIAGDIVDRGGYEEQWTNFDQYMPTLNGQYLQATVPGNHELYHSSQSSYIDESIYNEYYNNPKNGTEERPNSTYYFMYNNILFIMLDTMHRSNGDNLFEEQKAWFKQVVMNNPAEFIIVVTHPGCYSAGAYNDDAKQMKSVWRDTFEEYGVDLAISGHEHIYLRTKPLYQDKVNEEKGLTYVIGGCAGAKHYSGKTNDLFEVLLENDNPNGTYCGSIIEVVDNKLTMSYYDMFGNLRDSFTLYSKKHVDQTFTKEEFIDSLQVTYNRTTRYNVLSWDARAYGIFKQINIYMTHLDATYERYIGPTSNEQKVGLGIPNKDYNYKITFFDYDGNEYYTEIDVHNDQVALRPSDFALTVNEIENCKYELEISYNDKTLDEISLDLKYKDKTYSFKNHKLLIELNEEINLSKIEITLLYDFYGEGAEITLSEDDLELTLNLLEHQTPNNSKSGCFSSGAISLIITMFSLLGLSLIISKRRH